jgi:hypothetical protein
MSPEHRRFLGSQIAGAFVVNIPINAGLAWPSFPDRAPLFAKGPCVAFDTIGTSFFLPLITCAIVTFVVRRLRKSGKVARYEGGAFAWLPRRTVLRCLALGGLGVVLAAPVALGILAAAGVTEMEKLSIVVFKGIYGGVLAALVTPAVVLSALGESE